VPPIPTLELNLAKYVPAVISTYLLQNVDRFRVACGSSTQDPKPENPEPETRNPKPSLCRNWWIGSFNIPQTQPRRGCTHDGRVDSTCNKGLLPGAASLEPFADASEWIFKLPAFIKLTNADPEETSFQSRGIGFTHENAPGFRARVYVWPHFCFNAGPRSFTLNPSSITFNSITVQNVLN